ncbi:tol-pal system protein YbgF [Roseovarius sp. THAF9]|uniref:tol-pal system protein YbgF n=1 Tax=Roseovarius sp. THAF9 TaxID=2587847 RepID=UPI001267F5D1|nr:tol-pal system protein YbgF [Roseovarius sp. THAF9]QFT94094.1 tol-pal system protein YbgF [Roseovarius sp. THAF9]
MRRVILGLVVAAFGMGPVAASAQANTETLADIRQELSVLYVELQKLKRELNTTGASGNATVGGSVLDRVNTIESELQRLTSKTEELEFRIDSVVTDGTNRVGDLEFRICELEPSCDIGSIEPGDTLGGVEPSTSGQGTTSTAPATDTTGTATTGGTTGNDSGVQMAAAEQADFDTAMAAFEAGEYAAAAEQFERFTTNYPGSPMEAQAGLKRGEALEQANDMTGAARAYLDTFSTAPDGPQAPQALFLLGRSLGALGQTNEACLTLGEVAQRFPQSPAVGQAASAMQNLGCS